MEIVAVFFGQIEREMFLSEMYSIGRNTFFPENLQLLIAREQGQNDIWECPNDREKLGNNKQHPIESRGKET